MIPEAPSHITMKCVVVALLALKICMQAQLPFFNVVRSASLLMTVFHVFLLLIFTIANSNDQCTAHTMNICGSMLFIDAIKDIWKLSLAPISPPPR